MPEKNGPAKKEQDKDYGTSTDGETPASLPGDELAENPVGFGEDPGSAESGNIESSEEGGRTNIEEPI